MDLNFAAGGFWHHDRSQAPPLATAAVERLGPPHPVISPPFRRVTRWPFTFVVFSLGTTRNEVASSGAGAVSAHTQGRPSGDSAKNVPTPEFRDDAGRLACGSSSTTASRALRQLPETTAGGVGLLDYDGDGWLDVYVVQGGPFPPIPGRVRTRRPPVSQPRRRHV